MSILNRKIVSASVGALAIGVTLIASASPAAAWYPRHHGGWGGLGPALVGGLALGALAAGAYAASDCDLERRAVTNRRGDVVGYRRVRVC